MSADREVAILGVGMHPWGKWGRNFVEYGVVAAQAAYEVLTSAPCQPSACAKVAPAT